MANRIANRQLQIPNGYRFYIPAANWKSPPYLSFDRLVDKVLAVVKANPHLASQQQWPTDRAGVEQWVEAYNVSMCEANGWGNYLVREGGGSPEPPKIPPPPTSSARFAQLAAGAATLLDWVGAGGEPVSGDHANRRALVCAGTDEQSRCPQNQSGDLTAWFTKPASELIRRQLEKRKSLNLSTPCDARLNICDACACPLKLKVHVPLADILARIPPDSKAALDARCWILAEEKGA